MKKQDVLKEKAKTAIDKKAVYGADIDLDSYLEHGTEDSPVPDLTALPA